jgi:hypothetical protein
VPPGNRLKEMPELPNKTTSVRLGTMRSFDQQFLYEMKIFNDKAMLQLFHDVANKYEIDVVTLLATVLGEHTFNVAFTDRYQTDYLKYQMRSAKWEAKFNVNQVNLADIIQDPIMAPCNAPAITTDYDRWECYRFTWERSLRGKFFQGQQMPSKSFRMTFFNPTGAGLTYGIGQLDPLKALMFSDVVNATTGAPLLSVADVRGIYEAILNPQLSLQYTAALIQKIIQVYKTKAGFDISDNPGIVATLYNLGFENEHAVATFNLNKKSLKDGYITYPTENYYGWGMNTRLDDIRALANGTWNGQSATTVSLDAAADEAIRRHGGYVASTATSVKNGAAGAISEASNFFGNLFK